MSDLVRSNTPKSPPFLFSQHNLGYLRKLYQSEQSNKFNQDYGAPRQHLRSSSQKPFDVQPSTVREFSQITFYPKMNMNEGRSVFLQDVFKKNLQSNFRHKKTSKGTHQNWRHLVYQQNNAGRRSKSTELQMSHHKQMNIRQKKLLDAIYSKNIKTGYLQKQKQGRKAVPNFHQRKLRSKDQSFYNAPTQKETNQQMKITFDRVDLDARKVIDAKLFKRPIKWKQKSQNLMFE